jgi:hypothetical protein
MQELHNGCLRLLSALDQSCFSAQLPCHSCTPCEGASAVQTNFKLKLWPQPACRDPAPDLDSASLPELQAVHLLEGPLVTFRVTQAMLESGVMYMPAGHVVKVPEQLSEEPAIRLQVQVATGNTYSIYFAAAPRTEQQSVDGTVGSGAVAQGLGLAGTSAGEGPQIPGDTSSLSQPVELRAWRICGLSEVLQAVSCSVADELCIEKCGSESAGCVWPALQQ